MTRYGALRMDTAGRIACVFLPSLGSEGGEAILRGLTVIAGPPELPISGTNVLFFRPDARARLYGGLIGWAHTVRSYLAGRHLRASLVIGFDAHRVEAIARARSLLRVFASPEDERLAVCDLKAACVGFTPEERAIAAGRNIRTVRELASSTHPELAQPRARAKALLEGAPQLGLGFAEPSLRRSA